MIITLINFTNGKIKDENVHAAARAINRQIAEDFEPYWSFGATLRLEGRTTAKPSKTTMPDMRGAQGPMKSGRAQEPQVGGVTRAVHHAA